MADLFEELLKRSSVGVALDDIKKRGIEAHLRDLEWELRLSEVNRQRRARRRRVG